MSVTATPREGVGALEAALWGYYEEGRFVDCKVTCGGRGWACHRAVLAASSTFFDLALVPPSGCTSGSEVDEVVLPFPEDACAAFDDVLPYLYAPLTEADVKLHRTIPMLVLASLLGLSSLAQRLHDAMVSMSSVPLQCAAVMSLLVAPWLKSLEVDLCALAMQSKLPHEALSVVTSGAREAMSLCRSLHAACTAALQPMLPSLQVEELEPDIMLSLLRHPSANSHASDLAMKYLLRREPESVPGAVFSQLCEHVREVPASEVAAMLRLAVRRRDPTLISRCLSAASDTGGDGVDAALLDVLGARLPQREEPQQGSQERKRKYDACFDAEEREPWERPSDAQSPQDIGHLLSQPQGPTPAPPRPPEMAVDSQALFGSLHHDAPRWEAHEEDDAEEDTAVEALVATQSQGDNVGMQAALERLSRIIMSQRERRRATCRSVVADTRAVMQAKGDLLTDRCREMWGGVQEHTDIVLRHVQAESTRLREEASESFNTLARMRAACESMEAEVAVVLQRSQSLDDFAARVSKHNKAQIQAAGECSQKLVSVLKCEYESTTQHLERRLTNASERNGGALLKLSSLLAKELTME